MKTLKYLDNHFEEILIGIALSAITVIMAVQIVLRSFGHALPWAEEACRYLFVWSGSLGISFSTKEGSHLKLDILPSLFPPYKIVCEILGDAAVGVLCALLVRPGWKVVAMLLKTRQLSAALQMPMAYVYLAMLVGVILTIVRILEKYGKKLIRLSKREKEGT